MSAPQSQPTPPAPPVAARRPVRRVHHGDVFEDPYEWLRDGEDPEVVAYLEAENAWTAAATAGLEPLRTAIFDEIKARTKETDLTVPLYASHGERSFWYYERTVEGSDYAIYCRVRATGGPDQPPDVERPIAGEEVLLDANREAAGHDFFSLGAFTVSAQGSHLAFSVDTSGDERFVLRVKDLRSGSVLPDEIPDTAYGVAWAGAGHLFYVRADEAWRPYVVLRHELGSAVAADVAVFTEPDERFWVGVDGSRDDAWIVISSSSRLTSEVRLLSTADPEGEPRVVAVRRQGVEYEVEPAGDRLLIVHNDGAEDFALAEAPLEATGPEQWREVLGPQPGVRLTGVSAYASHAVLSLRRDGLTALHLMPRDPDGALQPGRDLTFDEPLYTVDSPAGPDFSTDRIRVGYTSLLTPGSVFDYLLATGELRLLKQVPVLPHPTLGPYDPRRYVSERTWATAADGTRVPLSVVRRADVALDGTAPALLYGYGSYEIPIDPAFAISRLSLLDRGIVFAIAHVRGGGELGRRWYEQGKTLQKRNTFTDFVACAEHLIASGYTAADRLAARGGSAGGLLMGAVANLAPHLFRAVHADVPFVDALTTILDPSLPLTVTEWEEWGDPLHDPEVYRYMKGYTPYENVTDGAHPAILATTSLNDTRVYFVEPAKWVAALRHAAPGGEGRDVLLRTEMVAGHGGVSGRYASWRQVAFEYAWIVSQITPRGTEKA